MPVNQKVLDWIEENREEIFKRLDERTKANSLNCFLLQGATSNGYGQISISGKTIRVHRLSAHLHYWQRTYIGKAELEGLWG